ncbi:MAG: Ig-like domain-containing protein [Fimbriimonadaceae bacterium]|nr:Ig-like domain-containing protein [Fimbriimonadaceae bacterium]
MRRHLLLALLLSPAWLRAADFTVTNTSDSGAGSLRQAVNDANSTGTTDRVVFNLAGPAPYTIKLLSAIGLGDDLTIDGTSQAGYAAAPLIEVTSEPSAPTGVALGIYGDRVTVLGLCLNRFSAYCFDILNVADATTIQGCYLDTDVTGTFGAYGLSAVNAVYAAGTNLQLGGLGANQGNVIGGNGQAAVYLNNSASAVVQGNRLGVAPDGVTSISAARQVGIVALTTAPSTIGGTAAGAGNLLANFTQIGIVVAGIPNPTAQVQGNSIWNCPIGIDLGGSGFTPNDAGDADTGPNEILNFPVIERASVIGGNLEVAGWSRPGTTVEFFKSANAAVEPGLGKTFLGRAVEGSGDDNDATASAYTSPVNGKFPGGDTTSRFRFSLPVSGLAAGDSICATATHSVGTSEFSPNWPVSGEAVQLVWTTHPSNIAAGTVFGTPLQIELRDSGGRLALQSSAVSLELLGNPTRVDGTTTVTSVDGVATFDNVYVTLAGSSHRLRASSGSLAPVNSNPFDAGPGPASALGTTAVVPDGRRGLVTQVAVTAKDQFGNALTAGGNSVVVQISGANSATATVTDHANGSYTASYTPANLGTDQIAVAIGGLAITGSPFDSVVSPGLPHHTTSTLAVPSGVAGQATSITLTGRDTGGTLCDGGGPVAVITVSGPNATVPAVTDLGNGTYTASYTPTVAGTDTITATLGGSALSQTAPTSVVAPAAGGANSTATPVAGTAGSLLTVTCQAIDAFGNVRPNGGDTVVGSIVSGPNTGASVAVSDQGDGTYDLRYTPLVVGTDQLQITVNAQPLAAGHVALPISPGPTAAATSTVSAPAGLAGAATLITLQARDAQGNARTSGGDVFVVAVNGANSATPAVSDLGTGSYTASYTPTVAGSDQISATLGGQPLSGSPQTSLVAAAAVAAAQSTAVVPGGFAGSATTVLVTARDSFGNALSSGGATVALAVTGANTAAASATDLGNGTYQLSYTPQQTGTDQVAITVNGAAIAGSPFASAVVAGPGHGSQSTANVPAGVAGAVTSSTVAAFDILGNARVVGGDTVAVSISGANAGAAVTATDQGTGSYTAQYTPTVSGTDQVAISVNGVALPGSPFASAVAPGAVSAPDCTATVGNGTAGVATVVAITARDAQGNALVTGGATFVVTVSGANSGTPTLVDAGNGTYSASYTPTASGTDQLAITLGGLAIGSSPLTSSVAPGAAAAAQSTLVVDRSEAVADGTDRVTATFTLRDAFGNLVPAVAAARLQLVGSPSSGLSFTQPSVAGDANGRSVASLSSTAAGQVTLGGRLDGAALPTAPTVRFVAGAGDLTQSGLAATPTNVTADGVATTMLTITVRDAQGNPVAGVAANSLLVSATPASGVSLTQPTAATAANGQTSATASSTQSGVVTFSATLLGAALPQTATVTFGAGAAAGSTCSLVADRSSFTADGSSPVTLTATVRDALGNPVVGLAAGSVAVLVQSGQSVSVTGPTQPTNAAGQVTATATTTVAQTITWALAVSGTTLPVTATAIATPGPAASLDFVTAPTTTGAGAAVAPAVQVAVLDAQGNRVSGFSSAVALTLAAAPAGGSLTGGTANAVGGLATFGDLRLPLVGTAYRLLASASGLTSATSSTFDVIVGPPDAAQSSFTAARDGLVADGTPVALAYQLRDAAGNPVALSAGQLSLSTPAGQEHLLLTGPSATAGTGQGSASVGASAPGEYALQLVATGVEIGTVTLTFVPRPVSAERSGVTVSAPAVAADGGTVDLLVTLRDQDGHPVNGSPVTARSLAIAGTTTDGSGLAVTAAGAVSDATGRFAMTLRATRADRYTLTPTVGGVALSSTTLRAAPATRVELPAGRHFLGLPVTPLDPSPPAVLGSTGWDLARWDSAAARFERYGPAADPADFAFLPGRGLWLRANQPLTLSVLGEAAPETPRDLPLAAGWNALGNPYRTALPWDLAGLRVLIDGVDRGPLGDPALWSAVRPYAWIFDAAAGTHRLVFGPELPGLSGGLTAVPPQHGFWVYALRPGVALRVAPAGGLGVVARAAPSPRDWAVGLTLRGPDGAATALVGSAARLTSALPVEQPPQEPPALRLQLVDGSSRRYGLLQPPATTWSWELRAAGTGELTLSWPSLLRDLPRGLVLELHDPTADRLVALNTAAAYRFRGDGNERPLRLTARSGQLSRPVIGSLSAQPARGGGLGVTVTLAAPAELTLTVRGLGGRLVQQVRAAGVAGPNELHWDGRTAAGSRAPSGNYVLELLARDAAGVTARAVRTVGLP